MTLLHGIVTKGQARGKELGFPTANIVLSQDISEGIYISETSLAGKTYPSLTFIGKALTFDETQLQAETYILDFDQDLYQQEITITLLEKIRENQKFASTQELVMQMQKDEQVARDYFQKTKKDL